MEGYVLCRPQGGINDMLSQVYLCLRYCEVMNRKLIIDTNYHSSHSFRQPFGDYFLSNDPKVFLPRNHASDIIKDKEEDVFPRFLSGKINTYLTRTYRPYEPIVEAISGEPITFSFQKRYKEKVLIHHQGGRNFYSYKALEKFNLKGDISQYILDSRAKLDRQYLGLHIRFTDYRSNYRVAVEEAMKLKQKQIYLATDNKELKAHLLRVKSSKEFVSMSESFGSAGSPGHLSRSYKTDLRLNNMSTLVDLFMLALSCKIISAPITRWETNYFKRRYTHKFQSGYAFLAEKLRTHPGLLSRVLDVSSSDL